MLSYIWKRLRSEERGFTLIELLIVILILGILAAIAIFASEPFRNRAAAACEDANERIRFLGEVAQGAGVEGDLYEFAGADPGACAAGFTGGGGGGGGATFTASQNGAAATGTTTATITGEDGELLVAISVHRQHDTLGTFPGTVSAAGWTFRGVAGFMSSTTDRRAVAVFTRPASGGADAFTPVWSEAASAHVIIQRFTVSAMPTVFTFAATNGTGATATTLALNGAAGVSGNSLMVVGFGARNDSPVITGFSWAGAGSTAQIGTNGVHAAMGSAQVSGAGPHSATANWTNAKHPSGFVLVMSP